MRKWFLILIPLSWCGAAVYFVPTEYATIQEAFDAIADGDTIYVDPSVYAEALQAPNLTFALLGNVIPDTGNYPRPVVDPSALPNPTSLACLTLPAGSHAVIEDFVFRNGPEMFPGRPFNSVGGILNHSLEVSLYRCLLDSTIHGLRPNPGRLNVIDCDFRDISGVCIYSPDPTNTRIVASGCAFSKVPGSGGFYLARFDDSSFVEDCWFKETVGTSMIWISGHGITIRDCLFGAAPSLTNEAVYGVSLQGCRIENNTFSGLQVQSSVAILSCSATTHDTCYITHNVFLHDTAGGGALNVQNNGEPFTVVVENNLFETLVGAAVSDAISSQGDIMIRRNRFIGAMQSSASAIYADTDWGTPVLRENLFIGTGQALVADGNSMLDARWNWWGDSTGPYHSIWNHAGQGDTVVGNILFDPWHTDTLFFLDTPERPPQLPDGFQLEVFPNPFNAVAMLKLFVDQPGIYRVDAFNVLGQHVEKIWSGPLAVDKQVLWDASHLTSGIYFVRVWQTIGNRPKAVQKLVLMK